MQTKPSAPTNRALNPFIEKHQKDVMGILHAFDRLRFQAAPSPRRFGSPVGAACPPPCQTMPSLRDCADRGGRRLLQRCRPCRDWKTRRSRETNKAPGHMRSPPARASSAHCWLPAKQAPINSSVWPRETYRIPRAPRACSSIVVRMERGSPRNSACAETAGSYCGSAGSGDGYESHRCCVPLLSLCLRVSVVPPPRTGWMKAVLRVFRVFRG